MKFTDILIPLVHDFWTIVKPVKVGTTTNDISYCNWWQYKNLQEEWFSRFLLSRFPKVKNFNIRFYSVFGDRKNIKKYQNKINIFFSGENLEYIAKYESLDRRNSFNKFFCSLEQYKDYAISDVDLTLGFGDIKNDKYLRFPLWIQTCFLPTSSYADIKDSVQAINDVKSREKKEAVCINRHDIFGMRGKVCDDLNSILNISYAGAWRNNTSELWDKYGNDKLKYMNLFRFNICPENMNAPNYCTEKIFESFMAGCVPIYAGALNNPEPDVINKDAIILWNLDGDNTDNIKLVKKLSSDEAYYNKFIQQERLLPFASEYVYDRFTGLEAKIKELLS